jgi:hypothetical protein
MPSIFALSSRYLRVRQVLWTNGARLLGLEQGRRERDNGQVVGGVV